MVVPAGAAGGTPADCSFFTKVQVAQTSGADAIIVLNEKDNSAITMDTSKLNGELTCAPVMRMSLKLFHVDAEN